MSIWDDPELKATGNYIAFEAVGDTVTGTILDIRAHRFDDGKVVPQIILDCDGEEKTLTAGQIRLKAELGETRPNVGDTLTVTLTEIEKRSGGKTLKHFDVNVAAGGGAPAGFAAEDTPAPEPQPAAGPDLAALGLSPAQLAALAAIK